MDAVRTAVETLIASPSWPEIVAAARLRPQRGIEIVAAHLTPAARAVRVPCAAHPDHPWSLALRQRQQPRDQTLDAFYISLTCPQALHPGCSRGGASRAAMTLLVDVLHGLRPAFPPAQRSLL